MKIRPAIPISIGVLALIVLGALLALRPAPVVVETSTVQIGRLQVVTEDQAETRSHDRYVVAAPVAGRLLRVMLREGDAVRQGDSVATLAPVPLSDREREEVTARVEAGTATERAAAAQLDHAVEDLAQARRESARLEELAARGLASAQQLEQARNTSTTMAMEAAAARDRVRAAEAEVRGARAALAGVQQRPGAPLLIRAPGTGR
ncbi:MAG: hypothetical protein JSR15_12135, partial [Proteobacteria bacterium]|nr:hypothetical protein [Pseudomonadota bacterium]